MKAVLQPTCRTQFSITDQVEKELKQPTADDHDTALRQVFAVAKQRNLRFKFEKCQFNQIELEFFGYIVSKIWISLSPSKVTVQESPSENASNIRSFLGICCNTADVLFQICLFSCTYGHELTENKLFSSL